MALLRPLNKTEKSPEEFWREYEENTGEKILARGLGRYSSGWEEFDNQRLTNLWGLIIAGTGTVRFHHFPEKNWFEALIRPGVHETPKEKIIIIPKEKIISARLIEEPKWWKKIITGPSTGLTINYQDGMGNERTLTLQVDFKHGDLAEAMNK